MQEIFQSWKKDCPNGEVSRATPAQLMELVYHLRDSSGPSLQELVKEGLRFDSLFKEGELCVPKDWVSHYSKASKRFVFNHPLRNLFLDIKTKSEFPFGNESSLEVLKTLFEVGFLSNIKKFDGLEVSSSEWIWFQQILRVASDMDMDKNEFKNRLIDILPTLEKLGFSVFEKSIDKTLAVHVAVFIQKWEVVEALLKYNPDLLDIEDGQGKTTAHYLEKHQKNWGGLPPAILAIKEERELSKTMPQPLNIAKTNRL